MYHCHETPQSQTWSRGERLWREQHSTVIKQQCRQPLRWWFLLTNQRAVLSQTDQSQSSIVSNWPIREQYYHKLNNYRRVPTFGLLGLLSQSNIIVTIKHQRQYTCSGSSASAGWYWEGGEECAASAQQSVREQRNASWRWETVDPSLEVWLVIHQSQSSILNNWPIRDQYWSLDISGMILFCRSMVRRRWISGD